MVVRSRLIPDDQPGGRERDRPGSRSSWLEETATLQNLPICRPKEGPVGPAAGGNNVGRRSGDRGKWTEQKSRHLSGPISCAFLLLPQVSDKKRMKEVAAEVRYKPRFALLEREIKGWKKSRHFTP